MLLAQDTNVFFKYISTGIVISTEILFHKNCVVYVKIYLFYLKELLSLIIYILF